MGISNDPIRKALQSYVQKVDRKKAVKVDGAQVKPASITRSDSVTISARADEVRKAKEAYNSLPETRKDVVESLKSKVQSGEYNVSSKEVADKIVHNAIVDKLL